mmetsp:Transcript_11665/g.38713  ORF Transcript_11665/g.38713 Transcript_11665/m.38713 type:complete len:104 (+) Transcript_11665:1108-1419(+)
MMCVHTPFRKSCECETRMRHFLYFARYPSSHTQASKSRWLVGSSRSNNVGAANSAFASATRMRHPPDMSSVGRWIMVSENPRACSSSLALDSNVVGSISSRRS